MGVNVPHNPNSIDLSELSPQGDQAADTLMDLIGLIPQLHAMLLELPQQEITLLTTRLNCFFDLVKGLPVRMQEKTFDTIGEA